MIGTRISTSQIVVRSIGNKKNQAVLVALIFMDFDPVVTGVGNFSLIRNDPDDFKHNTFDFDLDKACIYLQQQQPPIVNYEASNTQKISSSQT